MAKILSVVVHIKYSPKKARRMLNQEKTTMARNLRLDLTKLKLPHPPEANILSLIDEEEIAFFWETRKFSPLWTTVNNIVRLQVNNTRAAMKEVKIERMWMEETTERNPFTRKPCPVSPTSLSRRIRSRSPIRRRQTSLRQSSVYDGNRLTNQERRASRSSSPLPLNRTYPSRRNGTPERRNLDKTNFNTSHDTAAEHMLHTLRRIENVQMALLNIEQSQQQQTIIDQTRTERRASSPAYTTEIPTHDDIGTELNEHPLPLRFIHPSLPAIPSTVIAAEDFYPLSLSTTTAPKTYPGYSEYEDDPTSTKNTYHHLPEVIDTSWVWQSTSSPEPSTPSKPQPANFSSTNEKSNLDSFASDSKLPLSSTPPDPNALSGASTSSANGADLERISDLTREFWDTRRQLSAASARCLVLEKHLKASEIDLRKEIVESENRLLEERRERIHAETVLEDVLRECKEPSIIPALFATLMRDHGMEMVNS